MMLQSGGRTLCGGERERSRSASYEVPRPSPSGGGAPAPSAGTRAPQEPRNEGEQPGPASGHVSRPCRDEWGRGPKAGTRRKGGVRGGDAAAVIPRLRGRTTLLSPARDVKPGEVLLSAG